MTLAIAIGAAVFVIGALISEIRNQRATRIRRRQRQLSKQQEHKLRREIRFWMETNLCKPKWN